MKGNLIVLFILLSLAVLSQPVNPWSPPEYFPTEAVLIEWDFNEDTWELYSQLIAEIKTEAEVILVVNNLDEEIAFQSYLDDALISSTNISFVHVPCGRMWIRDHGPLAVNTNDGVAFMDFEDFASSGISASLPTSLASEWGLQSYDLTHIILDGGNFMVDSFGNMFSTNRLYSNNLGYTNANIWTILNQYMGISSIYSFEQMGDSDVWGHIDMQMKLLDDTTFVISSIQEGWPNHQVLEDNYQILLNLVSPYGNSYRVRKLPKADNWKSYTNSLLINNKLIMPVYDHPNDLIAMDTYQDLLPNHEIVGINANSIVGWDGVIHCITMQLFDSEVVTRMKNNNLSKQNINIFPNPVGVNEVFSIYMSSGKLNESHIKIYNTLGQIVYESLSCNAVELNADFERGLYFVEVISGDEYSEVIKLVVK